MATVAAAPLMLQAITVQLATRKHAHVDAIGDAKAATTARAPAVRVV